MKPTPPAPGGARACSFNVALRAVLCIVSLESRVKFLTKTFFGISLTRATRKLEAPHSLANSNDDIFSVLLKKKLKEQFSRMLGYE